MPAKKPTKKPIKKPAKKPATTSKPKPKPTSKPKPKLPTAEHFDGSMVIPLLGCAFDDPRLVAALASLGHKKARDRDRPDVDLKKLGIAFDFDTAAEPPTLSQVIFEIRRTWTGRQRYLGRLPHGLSSDHRTTQAMAAFGDQRPTHPELSSTGWVFYEFTDHSVGLGYGTTYLATFFLMAKAPRVATS